MRMRWENPPLAKGGSVDWEAVARKARSRPGKWLLVEGPVPTGASWTVRHGKPDCFEPAGSFDAVIRNSSRETMTGDLYVVYLGEADSE